MVALAPEGAKAVEGGNWQIFAQMVKASGANVHLNSAVTDIRLDAAKKYKITKTQTSGDTASPVPETHPIAFDDVIIATPFQFANISTEGNIIQHPIDAVPYATLHVTLFASPYKFSSSFFKLSPDANVPVSVLTTLGAGEEAHPGRSGAGKVGFYSATLQRIVVNPRTHHPEYVYKIFSPEAVTPGFLSELLGVEVPDSFTHKHGKDGNGSVDDSFVSPISWFHPAVFHPYPQMYPRVTFQDQILGNGLYYTSGIESFISTMETSALMGMNVARLIIDDYAGIPRAVDEEIGPLPVTPYPEGDEQDFLSHQQQETAKHYGRPVEDVNEL